MKAWIRKGSKITISILAFALFWILIWYACFIPHGFNGKLVSGYDYREVPYQDPKHVPLWENIETGEVYERTFSMFEGYFGLVGQNVFLKPMTSNEVFALDYESAIN